MQYLNLKELSNSILWGTETRDWKTRHQTAGLENAAWRSPQL